MSEHRDEAVNRLLPAIGRLSRRLTAASAVGGFTPTQLSVLGLVSRRGPLGLSELAALEGLNPTMLSRVVGKLDDAGLLRRTADPDDRRAARVEATAEGAALAGEVYATRSRLLAGELDQLEEAQLSALLAALPVLETLARELAPPGEPPEPKKRSVMHVGERR